MTKSVDFRATHRAESSFSRFCVWSAAQDADRLASLVSRPHKSMVGET